MKQQRHSPSRNAVNCLLAICTAVCMCLANAQAQVPRLINYQGALRQSAGSDAPDSVYAMRFALYDREAGGAALWEEAHSVMVTEGIFDVVLGATKALDLPFDRPYWLGLTVEPEIEMTPRVALTAVGYSLRSGAVEDGSVTSAGIRDGSVTGADLSSGAVVRSLNGWTDTVRLLAGEGIEITGEDGTLRIASTAAAGWQVGGNSGTIDTTDWLGTQDSTAFEIHTAGRRSLRIEPVSETWAPNVILGSRFNRVDSAARSATISGGGRDRSSFFANVVEGDLGTVGGGHGNLAGEGATVAGGQGNKAPGRVAAVSGGAGNTVDGDYSAVGGGILNRIEGAYSTVGGGTDNVVRGDYAVIGGGGIPPGAGGSFLQNQADGDWSVIPGGQGNITSGRFSFAGGRRAVAGHHGAFVWADTTSGPFPSERDNEFAVRATGGVRVITGFSSPGFNEIGAILRPGESSWATVSDARRKERFAEVDGDAVLAQLGRLPVPSWQYRGQQQPSRHYGPTAQDFYSAFGDDGIGAVGTDTTITASDIDGIALIAIKALLRRTVELEKEQQALREEIRALRRQLEMSRQETRGK